MQIPIDFSHKVIVEDLDTGKRAVFLIVRGTNERVRVPEQSEEEEFIPPPAEQLEELEQSDSVKTVTHKTVSTDVTPQTSGTLRPGSMGKTVGSTDVFGAHEG